MVPRIQKDVRPKLFFPCSLVGTSSWDWFYDSLWSSDVVVGASPATPSAYCSALAPLHRSRLWHIFHVSALISLTEIVAGADQAAEWSDRGRHSGDHRGQQPRPQGGRRQGQDQDRRHPVRARRLPGLRQDHVPHRTVARRDRRARHHRQHGRLHRIHRQILVQGPYPPPDLVDPLETAGSRVNPAYYNTQYHRVNREQSGQT